MPHASEIQGKYIPHNTNKPPPERYAASSDRSLLNGSAISYDSTETQRVDTDLSNVPQVSDKGRTNVSPPKGFWTTRKVIIVLIILVILLIGAGVAVALIFTLRNNKSDGTMDNTTSSTGATVTTTTVTTTTVSTTIVTNSTTAPLNPCASGALGWSRSGITMVSSSQITNPSGLHIDANNTLYIVDEFNNHVVWKLLNNASNLTLIAGTIQNRGANASQLNYPQGVYADRNGDVYVTDYYNYRVQKYINGSTNGVSIAGTNGTAGGGLSQFNGLRYFAVDATETYMYVTDQNNQRIMRYPTNSTSGANGVVVAGGSGGNSITTLNSPWGIFYSPSISSDLFITNLYGHSIMRWTPNATSGVFVAGTPGAAGQTPVLLNQPMGIKVDTYMNIYVADNNNHRIQMFCGNIQTATTIIGTGMAGNTATQLNGPRDIVFDSAMNIYVSDAGNNRIQKFNKL